MIKMSRIKFLLHQECPLWASISHKNKACAGIHVLYIVQFRSIPLKVTSVAKYNPHRKCAFELVNLHTKFDFKGYEKKLADFFSFLRQYWPISFFWHSWCYLGVQSYHCEYSSVMKACVIPYFLIFGPFWPVFFSTTSVNSIVWKWPEFCNFFPFLGGFWAVFASFWPV